MSLFPRDVVIEVIVYSSGNSSWIDDVINFRFILYMGWHIIWDTPWYAPFDSDLKTPFEYEE